MTTLSAAKLTDKGPVEWKQANAPVELAAEDLCFCAGLESSFTTTEKLEPGKVFVGQERAIASLEIGLGLTGNGFNIFVSGLAGDKKLSSLQQWVTEHTSASPTPGDWVYVHNFKYPDAPRAIYLQAGQGSQLKQRMRELVSRLNEELPKAFQEEVFDREKSTIKEKHNRRSQEVNSAFERRVREKGFLLQAGAKGSVLLMPVRDGKPLQSHEEISQLSQEEREAIEKKEQELMTEMADMVAKQQAVKRDMEADIRQAERRFCEKLLGPLIHKVEQELANEKVTGYLAEVRENILNNLDAFKNGRNAMSASPLVPLFRERDPFLEYEVNLVVDNAETKGPPVLVESAPTYLNLFGTIERVVDRFGRLVTNFTRVKSGSLLRAHGGYLIFSLEDAITEPAVWKVLKRTLRSGRIEMETYEPFALFSTSGLKPEPVNVDTKVIVLGSEFLYHLLYNWDEEFSEIFKVRADFCRVMELGGSHLDAYGGWVAKLCREEGLVHFDRSGLERLIQFGARQAGDREKMLASYMEIADMVREAAYWARKDGGKLVSSRHVEQALKDRTFRANRIEQEIQELVDKGIILVDIVGKRVGQVNSLSTLDIGGYTFGRPCRVTASAAMGQAGIINIERESHLSGSIHDKGVLILAGYLRNRYGQDKPLALSASLCFEQSYSWVEGDSASSAELYALVSRLANIPVRQDIGVTGSINQWGEVQAIGAVNEKIEGFFDACRGRGLTGYQGVMIPASNVHNLILREDVVRAVAEGQFHVYPVRTIDEGLEILTGIKFGALDEYGTVNQAADGRLKELALGLKEFGGGEGQKLISNQH